jgi:CheY-like chemotaxis protein
MAQPADKTRILMAEDDEDDRLMIMEALAEAGVHSRIECAGNGEELLEMLSLRGPAAERAASAPPAFILLDLNMPRLDGRETLGIIRQREELKKIPVIVFTTSNAADDIARSYETGANSYILKPSSYAAMVGIMKTLKSYWLETVSLPG